MAESLEIQPHSQKGVIVKFILVKRGKSIPQTDLFMAAIFASDKESKKTAPKTKKAESSPTETFGLTMLNNTMGKHLFASASKEGFLAKEAQGFCTHTLGQAPAQTIALYGLGPVKNQNLEIFRRFGGEAQKLAQNKRAAKLAISVPEQTTLPLFDVIQALVEGIKLSAYSFDRYLSKEKAEKYLKEVEIYLPEDQIPASYKTAITRAEDITKAVIEARDLINEGAGEVTPELIAKQAEKGAKEAGITIEIFDEKMLKKERMNLLLAVANAAQKTAPPRVIRLHYKPKGSKKVVVLVGKGVTFDTGGLDIKTADGMLDMKNDMSGAAAVFGTMMALGKLKPQVEVIGYLGCVENSIGPHAYHPGDIFRSRQGLTIEINNTDAEGRLVLADVIDYAEERDNPDILIDLATLTGACLIALGGRTAGLFSNDDTLAQGIETSAKSTGESFWRLPLLSELKDQLKSNHADMKNTGERYGGAITGALFLQEFIKEGVKWAHLDIAGPALNSKAHPYLPMGGTGFAIRTLVDFIMSQK